MEERRGVERISANIKCEVHSDTMTFSSTIDVSTGGLFISTPEPLHEGEVVRVQIYLPNEELITTRGRVKWYRDDETVSLRAGMGVEFIDLVDEDLHKIHKILK